MAGVTDSAFRTVCAAQGAAVTYTEMVSAKALIMGGDKSKTLLDIRDDHRPCIVQLFGSHPQTMAQAARMVADMCSPLAIDVNMGCPMPKIISNGDGSALMADEKLASQIVQAMVSAVDLPITVKFRSGITSESINAVSFAKAMENAGAHALCIHGRTQKQLYGGTADRAIIAEVKAAVSVPVIASGDAFSAQACMELIEQTMVDAVMIARGAQGRPHLFAQCVAAVEGRILPPMSIEQFVAIMDEHMCLTLERKGEHAVVEMRKHALWYLARIQGAKPFKTQMATVSSYAEFKEVCHQIIESGLTVKE